MATKTKFQKLLEPGHVGAVKTRNRIIKTGAAMMFWREDELKMNNKVKAYYEALAKGGVGLLVVESPIVDYPLGGRWRGRYRIDDDRFIEGISELPRIIHKEGCPTFMQMNHDGPWQTQGWDDQLNKPGEPPIASSPVSVKSINDLHNEVPRELSALEIEGIIDKLASAANRAKRAGFDGIDINSGSSHLLYNFLSPFYNRRQDIYGGNLENRTRVLRSIIPEIKKRNGQDFPVVVTINGSEVGRLIGIEDSKFLSQDDIKRIAQLIQEAGADAIQVRSEWVGYHVAGFLPETIFYPELPAAIKSFASRFDWSHGGKGAQVPLAAMIKEAVSIPLIAVGRLDPELGEKVLREGKADFIAMTRRLMADPDLPNKVASGRLDDIAPCTACYTCIKPESHGHCRINAALGSDEPYAITPAEKKKSVVIIGGGPAGMEAARVAALRGHKVTLFEKSSKLGGAVPLAEFAKEIEIQDPISVVQYLERQIRKLGVEVRLGKEPQLSAIEEIKPDVVILATGGSPTVPEIPGIEKRNVLTSPELHRRLKFYLRYMQPAALRWLTRFYLPIGRRVIIIGTEKQGCELAEFLIKRGRKVTLIDPQSSGEGGLKLAAGLSLVDISFFCWLQEKGVPVLSGVKCEQITNQGLVVINKDGSKSTIEADTIIPLPPLQPNDQLLKSLQERFSSVFVIGDCKEPRLIANAVADGWRVARHL